MTRHLFVICVVLTLATGRAVAEAPEGFAPLFNGQDLSGWVTLDPHRLANGQRTREEMAGDIEKHWRVEGNEIVNDGAGAYLTTTREYGDIELLIEYKTVAKADSGIYLRGTPQVQIWDFTEEGGKWNIGADKGSGGLYNNPKNQPGQTPLVLADKPFGEWNRFRIIQVGARTTVFLNDKLVVDNVIMQGYWDKKKPIPRTGPIMLQTHGGEIRWRNLYVRELTAEQATSYLRERREDGFESRFNGKDLTGWSGPVANYQVSDGAIVCLPGKGGTIFTDESYGDFKASIEFKLPEGGNNGLAIRYPGKGDTAYAGMCELQVLDNDHPKYAKLDKRQYHGSVYGMVPAVRGYLRSAGEWNYQEVTVTGSRITVELNGTVILDADVAKVKEYMNDRPHPGKDRAEGHFGLAGHNDPVAYRRIDIKRL